VEGGGHGLVREQPDLITAMIAAYLSNRAR
jgi:hypothetical protein